MLSRDWAFWEILAYEKINYELFKGYLKPYFVPFTFLRIKYLTAPPSDGLYLDIF